MKFRDLRKTEVTYQLSDNIAAVLKLGAETQLREPKYQRIDATVSQVSKQSG